MQTPRQRLDEASDRLPRALVAGVQTRKVALSEAGGLLRASTLTRMIGNKREALGRRGDRLRPETLTREIDRRKDRLGDLARRLDEATQRRIQAPRDKLAALGRMNETLSYKATLERGYAVVRGDGALVKTAAAARKADKIEIVFADDTFSPAAPTSSTAASMIRSFVRARRWMSGGSPRTTRPEKIAAVRFDHLRIRPHLTNSVA